MSADISRHPLAAFAGWIGLGVLIAIDALLFVSFFPLLVVTVPLTWAAWWGLSKVTARDWGRWGAVAGFALLPILFAYGNRHGPGTYCQTVGTPPYQGQDCGEYWDPRPWATFALLLVLIAPVGAWWQSRRL